jgi:tricorn protease
MKTPLALLTASLAFAAPALADDHGGIYPEYPTLMPDASFAIFSWAGDLWSVPASGGAATRLTSHPAEELASAVSPDGTQLAFESTRDGAKNLYLADLTVVNGTLIAGTPRRVTVSDTGQNLTAFTPDGEALLFSSFQERDIYREERMYRAPLDGGAVNRLTDAFGEHPAMSPDGTRVVFSRGGNTTYRPVYRGTATGEIWEFIPATGVFNRITTDDFDDIQPWALPDGSTIFISSNGGQYNIARAAPGARQPEMITGFAPGDAPFADAASIAHGVRDLGIAPDGSSAIFAVWDTLFTLDLDRPGATPVAIDIAISGDTDTGTIERMDLDREATETALSPDGKTIAIVARGEIFVRSTEDDRPTRRVTHGEAREQMIAWSPDGARLYFVSDRDGSEGIYAASVALSRHDLEPRDAEEEEADDEENADDAGDAGADDAENSDAPAGEDEDAENDEEDDGEEDEEEGPTPGERWAQSLRFAIEPIVVSDHVDRYPLPSPDGEELLFIRDRGDMMLYDMEDDELVTIRPGWNVPDVVWASDSEHIVFSVQDLQFNSDIWVMNVDAFEDDPDAPEAQPRNITRHPDLDVSPRLSHDGKVLYFLSDRDATENFDFDVYRVYLDESLEDMADYELADYFDEAAKAAKKLEPIDPVSFEDEDADDEEEPDDESGDDEGDESDEDEETLAFDTDDAFLRITRLTSIPASEGDLAITPAGDRVIFSSTIDGDRALYSVDYRGRERKSLVSGGVGSVTTSLTGDKAVLVNGGRAHSVPPAGGKVTTYGIDAPVTVDKAAERRQIFREGARIFGMSFYHPTLKGLDWDALSDRYEQLAMKTRTQQELNRVLSALFGEVDGSHTGAYRGPSYNAPAPRVGYLGIDAHPTADGYEVVRVLDDAPADAGEDGILDGDTITHINGEPLVDPAVGVLDLDAAMIGTAGKETLVTVRRPTDDGPVDRTLLLIPQSSGAESTMRYRDEVERREARVNEWSNGRIGYLHIRGMSAPQVRDYERDLYAAAHGKEGLIIDVRDNGGGWTTDILLASLTAPAHAYTVPRGANPDDAEFDSYPRDRRLIHAYQRPLTVLMNENSYSNAEIFSHSIKTTGRGKLVGTQTHGAVISTGGHTLINGSYVRIPFRGWYLPDGTDMDVYGAEPDIDVPMLPNDEAAGLDPQLKVAVEDLLRRIDRGEN